MPDRRLHLTLRLNDRRVTATFRRLWGEYDGPKPVIRLVLDPPPGIDWSWVMRLLSSEYFEVPVPDDWETITSQERYMRLRGEVLRLYEARAGLPDRHEDGRRKQRKRV